MSETADQATRRRWITLAEVVAVAGVVITGLTFWDNRTERQEETAQKRAADAGARASAARLALSADVVENGRQVALRDPRHDLLDVRIDLPRSLGEARFPAVPRIDRDWLAPGILRATDGGADAIEGRVPVLVTASFLDGDTRRTERAIVDIAWRTKGRLIGGRTLEVEDAAVRSRGGDRAAVDALWARELARAKR